MLGGWGGFEATLSELVEAARLRRVAVVWFVIDEVEPSEVSKCWWLLSCCVGSPKMESETDVELTSTTSRCIRFNRPDDARRALLAVASASCSGSLSSSSLLFCLSSLSSSLSSLFCCNSPLPSSSVASAERKLPLGGCHGLTSFHLDDEDADEADALLLPDFCGLLLPPAALLLDVVRLLAVVELAAALLELLEADGFAEAYTSTGMTAVQLARASRLPVLCSVCLALQVLSGGLQYSVRSQSGVWSGLAGFFSVVWAYCAVMNALLCEELDVGVVGRGESCPSAIIAINACKLRRFPLSFPPTRRHPANVHILSIITSRNETDARDSHMAEIFCQRLLYSATCRLD